MPAYDTDTSLDHAMDTEDRVSPGPREPLMHHVMQSNILRI